MTQRTPIQLARDLKASTPSPDTNTTRRLAEALLDATDELERLHRIAAAGPFGDPSLEGVVPHITRIPVRVDDTPEGKFASVFGYGEQGQHACVGIVQGALGEAKFYAALGRYVFRAAQGLPVLYAHSEDPTHEA